MATRRGRERELPGSRWLGVDAATHDTL